MNFYEILKTKKLGRGSPDYWTQLFAEHVGGKGGWKVTELTGTLPITFRSNGTALIDYRIFGTADGAGVQTENLFDYRKEFDDSTIIYNTYFKYYPLQLEPNTTYTAYTNAVSSYQPLIDNYETTFIITADEIVFNTANGGVFQNSPRTITTRDSGIVKVGLRRYSGSEMPIYTESDFASADVWLNLVDGSTAPDHYIPYGYKLPLTLKSGTKSKDTDIYIGDSKLGAEEYVDYEDHKVYKRTENLFDPNLATPNSYYNQYGVLTPTTENLTASPQIPVEKGETYIRSSQGTAVGNIYVIFDSDKNFLYRGAPSPAGLPIIIEDNGAYIGFTIDPEATPLQNYMFTKGSTPPETYTPYLQPTNPPLPLPVIETFKGTNTLDSTETLGEVTIKGQIIPQS